LPNSRSALSEQNLTAPIIPAKVLRLILRPVRALGVPRYWYCKSRSYRLLVLQEQVVPPPVRLVHIEFNLADATWQGAVSEEGRRNIDLWTG
jgi:hypothetical protein